MFGGRAFNIAFIVSFVWHIAVIASVNIVVLPSKFTVREFVPIAFLGPILEKRALDIMIAGKPSASATNYKSDLKDVSEVRDVKNEAFRISDAVRDDISKRAEKKMNAALSMPFREAKDLPRPAAARSAKKMPPEPAGSGAKGMGISGPLADREVFYKPAKPTVPEWVSSSASYSMELKFFVTAQGDVKEVIPVVSSGNAEIDLLGIRYLKEWRFTPIAEGNSSSGGEDEWGRIKMVFSKE